MNVFSRRQNNRYCPLSAFTLLEIILVVMVLAILAGLVTANYQGPLARYRLFKAADDLVYHMRFAQARAVSQGKFLRLQFGADGQHYQLTESSASGIDIPDGSKFGPLSGHMGATVHIDSDVKVALESATVHFHPDGRIDKQELSLCRPPRCFTISTKIQRGSVKMFESTAEQ